MALTAMVLGSCRSFLSSGSHQQTIISKTRQSSFYWWFTRRDLCPCRIWMNSSSRSPLTDFYIQENQTPPTSLTPMLFFLPLSNHLSFRWKFCPSASALVPYIGHYGFQLLIVWQSGPQCWHKIAKSAAEIAKLHEAGMLINYRKICFMQPFVWRHSK